MKIKIIILLLSIIFLLNSNSVFGESLSSPSAVPKEVKEYVLPFPGMLPDNPLYKLKVLRDKISLLFIGNPNKKIEFYLLLTDKGIAAAKILVDQNKITLAKETALKGENNYTLLTNTIKDNKWDISKKEFKKVEIAALKHQEILKEIISKVDKKNRKTFEQVLYFSKINLSEIKNTQKTLNP